MRWILPACGLFVGAFCGGAAYAAANTFIDWRPLIAVPESHTLMNGWIMYRHAGTVVSHDMANKTITIQEESSFGNASSTITARFTYDDATEWHSIEYVFRGGVRETSNLTENERERQLPEGTLVALVRDPTITTPWRIAKIAFLRRTDL